LGPEHSGSSLQAPFSNAWFVERGWARAVVDDADATAHAGQWLLLRPGRRYQEFSPDVILLSIRFIWEWFSGEPLFPLQCHIRLQHPARALTDSAYALEKHVTRELGDPHVRLPFTEVPLVPQLRIEQHFLQWLTAYAEALADAGHAPTTPRNLHPALQRALRFIETEPLADLRRESAVAAAARISTGHLNRLATNQFGASIRELIERRRLNVAHLLLEQPGIAVKEVAWRVGFGSPQNFSTWFRRRTGRAPVSLRRKKE
jgi:AraC-like DNA-binding protein